MSERILIIDNAVHRLVFKPSWHWRAHLRGIQSTSVNLPSARTNPTLDGISHLILTGSEASILEPKPWYDREADLVRQAVAREIPILGSCFGHQMLVYALSGPESLQPSDPPEVGWARVEMTNRDVLFNDVRNPWHTFVYHFDEVINPPAPWIKLGRTRHCDTHVLRYGEKPVWGIQAHPEISSRKARFFIRATLLMGRKPTGHLLRALRNVPPPDDTADRILHAFIAQ